MRTYFVHLENTTDSADDDFVKVLASNPKQAKQVAIEYNCYRSNYTIGSIYNRKRFKKEFPDWHAVLWGLKAVNKR